MNNFICVQSYRELYFYFLNTEFFFVAYEILFCKNIYRVPERESFSLHRIEMDNN